MAELPTRPINQAIKLLWLLPMMLASILSGLGALALMGPALASVDSHIGIFEASISLACPEKVTPGESVILRALVTPRLTDDNALYSTTVSFTQQGTSICDTLTKDIPNNVASEFTCETTTSLDLQAQQETYSVTATIDDLPWPVAATCVSIVPQAIPVWERLFVITSFWQALATVSVFVTIPFAIGLPIIRQNIQPLPKGFWLVALSGLFLILCGVVIILLPLLAY